MTQGTLHTARYTPEQRFEAAQWFIEIYETEEPSSELLQRWQRWLDASDAHRLAFEAVERVWRDAPEDEEIAADDADDDSYDCEIPITEWLNRRRAASSRRGFRPLATGFSRPRVARLGAVIGAALVLVASVSWWLDRPAAEPRHSAGRFSTGTGEHMEITLADGSIVSLGARTTVSVKFTATERRLQLDAGEAFFTVHKDARRPFDVHALSGVITAVGTSFNVRALDNLVTVAVAEGAVNVSDAVYAPVAPDPSRQTRAHVTRLDSGEQLTFTMRPSSAALEKVALNRIDSAMAARWRDGWLVYRDAPLRYVIADVARYTDRHVAVSEGVGQMRFTGAVFQDSVLEWLEALPAVFPVTVRSKGGDMVVAPIATPAPPVTTAVR